MSNVIAEMKHAATENYAERNKRLSGPSIRGEDERNVGGKVVAIHYGRKGFEYFVRDERGYLDPVKLDELEALAAANRVETFKQYCIDKGDTEVLEDALFFSPDDADLEHWQITEGEYCEAVRGALDALKAKEAERIDEVVNGQEAFIEMIAEGKRGQAATQYENYMQEHAKTIADWEERTFTKRGIIGRNRRMEKALTRAGADRMADYHKMMADNTRI